MVVEVDRCPTCGSDSYVVHGLTPDKNNEMQACLDRWHSKTELEVAQERAVPDIDRTKMFYLSGPMQGYEDLNFPAFVEAAAELRRVGLMITSPNELRLPQEPDPKKEGLDYLANDFAVMSACCDGIILLKGWPRSVGARAELEIALTLKWPVYYYHDFQLTDMNKEGVN